MSKRNIAVIASLVVLLGGGIMTAFIVANFNSKKIEKSSAKQAASNLPIPTSATTTIPDKTYEDEAGFSFKYPANFVVSDTTPTDPKYYTQLIIKGEGGEVKLSAYDTTYKTVEDWLKKDKNAPKGTTASGATTLGG